MNSLFAFGQEEDGLCSRHAMLYCREADIDGQRVVIEYCPVCYRFRSLEGWREMPFELNGRVLNMLESLNSYVPQGMYFRNMSLRTFPLGRDARKLCAQHQTEGIVRGASGTKEFCPDCERAAYEARKRDEASRQRRVRRTCQGRCQRLKASLCKKCRRTMMVRSGELACPECTGAVTLESEVPTVRSDRAIQVSVNRARCEEVSER